VSARVWESMEVKWWKLELAGWLRNCLVFCHHDLELDLAFPFPLLFYSLPQLFPPFLLPPLLNLGKWVQPRKNWLKTEDGNLLVIFWMMRYLLLHFSVMTFNMCFKCVLILVFFFVPPKTDHGSVVPFGDRDRHHWH